MEGTNFFELRGGGVIAYRRAGVARGAPPRLMLRPLGGGFQRWGELRQRLARRFEARSVL